MNTIHGKQMLTINVDGVDCVILSNQKSDSKPSVKVDADLMKNVKAYLANLKSGDFQ